MAITDHVSTLAYHSSRPLGMKRDMSSVPVASVVTALREYKNNDKASNTQPCVEALWFYGCNHGVALIASAYHPHEPLSVEDNKFVSDYYTQMADKALRSFYYLLVICVREARHNKAYAGSHYAEMAKKSCKAAANFLQANGNENTIHETLMKTPPDCTIGELTTALLFAFNNGSWAGGYGGVAWAKVTDCLHQFVHGAYSAEMMLDTIWTLSHNNGPIFNKGHFYAHHGSHLLNILDIQRSGQILEAINGSDEFCEEYLNPDLKTMAKWVRTRFPDAIGGYVDYYKVEALGALGNYHHNQLAQDQKYGVSVYASQMQQMAQQAKAAKLKAAQQAKEEHLKNNVEVLPDVFLPKFKIERVA